MSEILSMAALEYVSAGLHILALHHKRPNSRFHEHHSYENSIHGVPETPEEMAAFDAVWDHPSTTGVAILIPPHILVADIDSDSAAAIWMDTVGALPDAPMARTIKGLHVWFYSPGAEGGCWVGGKDGLLFKGLGGYVAAPPSMHFNDEGEQDGVYTWINPLVLGNRVRDMVDLPSAMADRVKISTSLAAERAGNTEDYSAAILVAEGPGSWKDGTLKWRIEWQTAGLEKAVRGAGEGNRNNMLSWAAMTAAETGIPFDIAAPLLTQAALDAGLDPRETRVTIRAAYRRRAR